MLNIIIPSYKARETLPQALDSLVAQTKKLFIITIVQDADGEDYKDIIEEYTHRGLKIRLLATPVNGGPGNARQYGMDNDLMCDYFAFMDADDMFTPRAVEILYGEAKRHDADIVLTDFYAERAHEPGIYLSCNSTPITWCHGKIYKAKYLRENHIRFLPELRLNEDSYFNLVAVNATSKKFYINELTYLWRDNKNSLTRAEGATNFFLKSWEQYILSQVQALIDISKLRGTVNSDVLAATLINIYDHCMKAIYLNCNSDLKILSLLGQLTVVKNGINTTQFWEYVQEHLKACVMFDDCLIFYKQRFCDWLNALMAEDNK